MKIIFIKRTQYRIPRRFLVKWIDQLAVKLCRQPRLASMIKSRGELILVFCEEAEMRALNGRFRQKDRPTDVLSFVALDDDSLGELIICPSVVRANAKAHGLGVRDELGYVVLHGILHLLGYEHEKGCKQAAAMFTLQDDLFERLCRDHERSRRRRVRQRTTSR